MTRNKLSKAWLAVLILLLTSMGPASAQLEYRQRTEDYLSGEDLSLGVQLTAKVSQPEVFEVEIRLPGRRILEVLADYKSSWLSISSVLDSTQEPSAIDPGDSVLAFKLLQSMAPPSSRLEEILQMTLNLLTEAPPGYTLAISTPLETPRQVVGDQIISLCNLAGGQREASYDARGVVYTETVLVGPCYNQGNQCFGRCGIGCGVLGSKLVQQFAQDCLDHDLCRLRTGANVTAPCGDEFDEAADDFFAAPDCGSMKGSWVDNYNYSWKLRQESSGIVSGTVKLPECGDYTVRGNHRDSRINITASRLFPRENCCRSFTYKGSFNGCGQIPGTWTNACRGNGSFSLSRQGRSAKETMEPGEEDKAASPASIDPSPEPRR